VEGGQAATCGNRWAAHGWDLWDSCDLWDGVHYAHAVSERPVKDLISPMSPMGPIRMPLLRPPPVPIPRPFAVSPPHAPLVICHLSFHGSSRPRRAR
jgi:hypothetical protein